MLKFMKPGRNYFVINVDEPYAKVIYEVLKYGQIQKGEWPEGDISFEEWVEKTFTIEEYTNLLKKMSSAMEKVMEETRFEN